MPDIERFALILNAVRELNKARSWTGKTHVIKTMYLANTKTKLPFDFVLYKHGPYSFEVNDALEVMSAVGILKMSSTPPYGVQLRPGEFATLVDGSLPLDPGAFRSIEDASRFVGNRDVVGLETLATAMWVKSKDQPDSDATWKDKVKQLKPHLDEAVIAREIEALKAGWI